MFGIKKIVRNTLDCRVPIDWPREQTLLEKAKEDFVSEPTRFMNKVIDVFREEFDKTTSLNSQDFDVTKKDMATFHIDGLNFIARDSVTGYTVYLYLVNPFTNDDSVRVHTLADIYEAYSKFQK